MTNEPHTIIPSKGVGGARGLGWDGLSPTNAGERRQPLWEL